MPGTVTSVPHALTPIEPSRAVGRRVLDADGVTVVSLAIASGAGLDDHRTPFPLLLQTITGHVVVTVGGAVYDLRPGDLLHLPAHEVHAVRSDVDSHLCLVLLGEPRPRDEAS